MLATPPNVGVALENSEMFFSGILLPTALPNGLDVGIAEPVWAGVDDDSLPRRVLDEPLLPKGLADSGTDDTVSVEPLGTVFCGIVLDVLLANGFVAGIVGPGWVEIGWLPAPDAVSGSAEETGDTVFRGCVPAVLPPNGFVFGRVD